MTSRSEMLRAKVSKDNLAVQAYQGFLIDHEAFIKGMDKLRYAYTLSGREGGGIIVEGTYGVGKSSLLRKFEAEINREKEAILSSNDETDWYPIVNVAVPGQPTIPRIVEKILSSINHIKPISRGGAEMQHKLSTAIEEQEISMLILDEYQHLFRTDKYARETMNFLKVLMDDHKLSLVFSGLPSGRKVLKDFPEMRDRLSFGDAVLKPFDMSNEANYTEFAQFIKAIENKLQEIGVKCIPLMTEDMLPRLLLATNGKPRFIQRLMLRLLMHCGLYEPITQRHFVQAFEALNFSIENANKHFNPFLPRTQMAKICELQRGIEKNREVY